MDKHVEEDSPSNEEASVDAPVVKEDSPTNQASVDAPVVEDSPSNEASVDAPGVEETLYEDSHSNDAPIVEETSLDETGPFQPPARSSAVETISSSSHAEVTCEGVDVQQNEGGIDRESVFDDEVILESSFIPSSTHPQLHRQAVRESPCIDSHCAREAAMMLRCLPPLEAARLALSMEDEERLAAFSYMSQKERSAVIAGMPLDTAVAAGLIDPSFDGTIEDLLSDEDEGSKRWFPSTSSFSSSSRVGTIGSKARGAASSAATSLRQGLTQAVERGRTVEMPAKVTEYSGKVSGAASRTAGLAREKVLQAAEKAKVSAEKSKVTELGGRAIGVAGNAARRAKEATVKATPSSTVEAKEKAKEKVAVAADTASHALSSMSKGFASMMKRPSPQKSSPELH